MIDTTDINKRQLSDVLWEMINEINTLDTELKLIKAELQHIKRNEV